MPTTLYRSLLAVAFCASAHLAFAASPVVKVSPAVLAEARREPFVDVLIVPNSSLALDAKRLPVAREARLQAAADTLRNAAGASQRGIVAELASRGIVHRAYWVVNVIQARVPAASLTALAARGDIARIIANPRIHNPLPAATPAEPRIAKAVQANLSAVGADAVWAQGFRGQGIVVAGQDTGYQWDHPALKAKYRGWNGAGADHSYNWHDAIHAPVIAGDNPCGYSSSVPCDDGSHGTHTMGTMVGDDGGLYQIGMAPDARWIGCRNMDRGVGTPATYIECFQWFLAPTDNNDANPDSAKAPHVINNSWTCPPQEGCNAAQIALLREAVENVRAAGILVVVAAGNGGGGCGSVSDPPATLDASFTIGATGNNGGIANFSSRGPVTSDGSNRLKPDLSAPGVQIPSSVPGGSYANFNGTSMASPHVAGAAALLMSAVPWLVGNPDFLEQVLREGAVPKTDAQNCGGFSGSAVPNAVYGSGFLDVASALDAAVTRLFAHGFE